MYRVERELAAGRSGRVVAAWDTRHGRCVALKIFSGDAGAREVRVLATLQHHAIPSPYDSGTLPSGELFYAMRLVSGRSLAEVLADEPAARERLELVGRTIDVVEAVAHAHARGVAHGDLGVASILVGTFGETVVVGWGRADALDPESTRADVRALGAALAQILGADAPPELAAIARAEYVSAADLAADLRRHQAGQLVSAHRYGLGALAARWLRQHRALAAAAAAVVVAGGLAGATSLRSVVQARDRADALTAAAEAERQAAAVQRQAAEDLVDYIVVDVRKRLATVGKLELMSSVGGAIVAHYRRLAAAGEPRTAATLAHEAEGFAALADVEEARREFLLARSLAQTSIALSNRSLALARDDVEVGARLVAAYTLLGDVAFNLGASDEMVARSRQAVDVATQLVRDHPESRRARLALSQAENDLAVALQGKGGAPVLALSLAARDMVVPLVVASPGDEELLDALAQMDLNVSTLASNAGDMASAIRGARRSLALRGVLLVRHPESPSLQLGVARAQEALGRYSLRRGDLGQALATFASCRDIRARLVERDAANRVWRKLLAVCSSELADVELELGAAQAALATWRELAEANDRLASTHLEDTVAQRDAGSYLNDMAGAQIETGSFRAALADAERAVRIFQRLVSRDPKRWDWLNPLARAERLASRAALALGQTEAAVTHARASVDAGQRLAQVNATSFFTLEYLAADRETLGRAFAARGAQAAARAELKAALDLFDTLRRREPDNASLAADAAESLLDLAAVLARLGDRGGARARREQARAILERLDREHHLSPRRAHLLDEARYSLR